MNVAVVIPTYNRRDMVSDAIASALAQDTPARVIVVDDGSDDGTTPWIRERFGGQIEVVVQENRERGAARNAGAGLALDADLYCFLDADDILRPGHVGVLVEAARRRPETTLVTARAWAASLDLQPLRPLVANPVGDLDLRAFLDGRRVVPPSATAFRGPLFRTLGGFDVRRELAGSEDWLLVARFLARGAGTQVDHETVLLRKHPGNTMARPDDMLGSMRMSRRVFFEEYAEEWATAPASRLLPPDMPDRARAVVLIQAATGYYGAGEMRRARALLREALRTHPRRAGSDWRVPWTYFRSLLGSRITRGLRRWRDGRAQVR